MGNSKRKLMCWIGSLILVLIFIMMIFGQLNNQAINKNTNLLSSMCNERARLFEAQWNLSMNNLQALSILMNTLYHGKSPPAINKRTFAKYTETTSFERPLTNGVAYAVRVLHTEREKFEKKQGWFIKTMESIDQQNPGHEDNYSPPKFIPSPIQNEYAPVIFAQDTIAHLISLDMLSGKEDRDNVLRARESGKGVLTAPFRVLKTNRLSVISTFAVYARVLPSNVAPKERIEATTGYLRGIFDIESFVKLLQLFSSQHTILVGVYDTTNHSRISMCDLNVSIGRLDHVIIHSLNLGDPFRNHEIHCRFNQNQSVLSWHAITTSHKILVISLTVGYILLCGLVKARNYYNNTMKLNKKDEVVIVAKTRFLTIVSHNIRNQMNGVLGMLGMLVDTRLDPAQRDYVQVALESGKALVTLIDQLLDRENTESGILELESVRFDLREILDNVLLLFSGISQNKGVELAVYVSEEVPNMLIGDPGKFRQIIMNLMGNSVKFTTKGHVFVIVHLVEEVNESVGTEIEASSENSLSGLPVLERRHSWAAFRTFNQDGSSGSSSKSSPNLINIIVSVEDTGEGIPPEAQSSIFTPFVQVGSSKSSKLEGTGIGLSITKELVKKMNGEIGFVSVPMIGSTFTFTVVFTNDSSNANDCKSQKLNKSEGNNFEFQGKKVLIVDSKFVRAKVSRYHLQRLGLQVIVARTMDQSLWGKIVQKSIFYMFLVEQDVWDTNSEISSLFFKGVSQNVFLLANSSGSENGSCSPSIIVKPLRRSVLATSLRRVVWEENKGNPLIKELPSFSCHTLIAGKKILIVDDCSVNLKVATGALKKWGAIVESAESSEKAVSFLHPPHTFDACLMDIQMPEMDGFEATRKIREIEREVNGDASNGARSINHPKWHVPILAITASVEVTEEECKRHGMDGYITKPYDQDQLHQLLLCLFQCPQ